jgi:hypothetical protein
MSSPGGGDVLRLAVAGAWGFYTDEQDEKDGLRPE